MPGITLREALSRFEYALTRNVLGAAANAVENHFRSNQDATLEPFVEELRKFPMHHSAAFIQSLVESADRGRVGLKAGSSAHRHGDTSFV